jgi:hypothetical protein
MVSGVRLRRNSKKDVWNGVLDRVERKEEIGVEKPVENKSMRDGRKKCDP